MRESSWNLEDSMRALPRIRVKDNLPNNCPVTSLYWRPLLLASAAAICLTWFTAPECKPPSVSMANGRKTRPSKNRTIAAWTNMTNRPIKFTSQLIWLDKNCVIQNSPYEWQSSLYGVYRRLYSSLLGIESTLCKTPHFLWVYRKVNQIYEKFNSDQMDQKSMLGGPKPI